MTRIRRRQHVGRALPAAMFMRGGQCPPYMACLFAVFLIARSSTAAVDIQRLEQADRLIDDAIAQKKLPGAVLLVGQGDQIVYQKAYGDRVVEPQHVAMTSDTIFDMASLTKPMATAILIMLLSERGKLSIADKVAKYIPEFAQNGKQDITIEQLLLHRSGFVPDNPVSDYEHGPAEAMRKIYALKPETEPGTHFAYSDVNYIVLGELVRVISGKPLDEFARQEIYEPLDMPHTRFLPPAAWHDRFAPTEQRDGHWMIGQVHDPRAYALVGVAGHAGLFSTAEDVSRFCRMILHGGTLDGHRILSEQTVREMTKQRCLPDGTGCRSYVFDVDTPYSGCRGDRFDRGTTFGHTGFTGTMFWIDPTHQCYVILLSNSVHPDGKGNVLRLRHDVATLAALALLGPERDKPVLAGIDVLEKQDFKPLRGKRVALVTNHTGLDAVGKRTVDVLAAAKDVKLIKLFSPEHGLYGLLDEKISDTTDPQTGLHVYSLYGKTQKPNDEMLKDLDAIVYEIQDVGARYYTYTTTLGYCMEAAAAHKIPIFVLDRPNPVTGYLVDGPVADEDQLSFIAYAPIPVSHGMTHGELARMFNDERKIHCDLHVIEMENWHRWMWWDDTGRKWVNPSPNMRNPTQALLYLGIGLLESSNLSVGRGTDQPFELFGAPWIDERKLAQVLNNAGLPGLRFTPITFMPKSSKFADKECHGCYVQVIDRAAVQPVRAGVAIAWHLRHLFGDAFDFQAVGKMVRNAGAMKALGSADDPEQVAKVWSQPLDEFTRLREKYLIYR